MKVADKTYYLNADKSKAIPANRPKKGEDAFDETPEGAAFLLVREGQELTAEMEEKYGLKGAEKEEAPAEPGVVLSDVGGEQGFVAAAEVQKSGVVVTDAPEPGELETKKAAPKTPAKKAAARKK